MNNTYFFAPAIFFVITAFVIPQTQENSLDRKLRSFGRKYQFWKRTAKRHKTDVAQLAVLPLSAFGRGLGRSVKVLENMATLFRTDGTVQKIVPKSKEHGFTEIDIVNLLASSIHAVPLDKTRLLFVQSDPSEQSRNNRATEFARGALCTREAPANEITVIHGNALVVRYEEMRIGQLLALKALMY